MVYLGTRLQPRALLMPNGTLNTYIEDSVFSYVGQAPDVDDSGRIVIRHFLQFIGSSGLTHGTTSTYGGRQVKSTTTLSLIRT